jgi:hypothetical protein
MKRYIHASSDLMDGFRVFVQDDNGGRGILITDGSDWWYTDCAPDGMYGDVDILEGSSESVAQKLRAAYESGEIGFDPDYGFRRVDEYSGYTLDDIDDLANYETNSFGDRVPIGHDNTSWVEV